MTSHHAATLDRARLARLMERETTRFAEMHPRSGELFARARGPLLDGVPMNWMVKWAGPHPVFVERAEGARFLDVDGNAYADFCLGDTGAMAGHSPAPTVEAVRRQVARGITTMLPTEDAIAVGQELQRRFGLRYWQFTLTATDANRFALRLARMLTGRPKILVHDECYHGSVDESLAALDPDGTVRPRHGNIGPQVDPAVTTKVVEFNDVDALERALTPGDVAAVLIEPALTNVGIILPDPGYHDAVREITRRTGTILIIDETHTISAGPGGMTAAYGLRPDMLTIGKSIGGGIPVGTYGMSEEIGARVSSSIPVEDADVGGIGGTLAGYALSLAAVRATLTEVLTPEAYTRTIPLAQRWEAGVRDAIGRRSVPWYVTRLGCRAEYHFLPEPARTGREHAASNDVELERFLHLHALNRGILLTPFHNMALMSPATVEADVDLHTAAFEEAIEDLFGQD